ncbi:hypothetical protein VTN00DRAFT_7034 [Thermoascus crustaceus]|uniref:uncharacterized protein n=1 Tax=Thermoascus crustaceus TaxID=5088 RepID=UPI0037443744
MHREVTSDTHKFPVVERGVMVVEAGLVDAISTGDHGQSERRPSRSPSKLHPLHPIEARSLWRHAVNLLWSPVKMAIRRSWSSVPVVWFSPSLRSVVLRARGIPSVRIRRLEQDYIFRLCTEHTRPLVQGSRVDSGRVASPSTADAASVRRSGCIIDIYRLPGVWSASVCLDSMAVNTARSVSVTLTLLYRPWCPAFNPETPSDEPSDDSSWPGAYQISIPGQENRAMYLGGVSGPPISRASIYDSPPAYVSPVQPPPLHLALELSM